MARKSNSHDFKRAKTRVLSGYAKKRGLRKGSASYNAYVHGSVSRAMARKRAKRKH